MSSIETLQQERTNLDLHVDLCAKRYSELDQRLCSLDSKLDVVSEKVDGIKGDLMKVLIPAIGTIVVSIITLVGTVIIKTM